MSPLARGMLVVLVVGFAVAVRVAMFRYQSMDYLTSLSRWYEFIAGNGGFRALRYEFANYNVPYLYLLAALTYLPIPALTGIKLISVAFDLLLAYFVYRIVNLRYPGSWPPVLAGAIVLFLPTVATNSALWAQSDSVYAAFAVGGLYYVLRSRPWLACAFFGLAFAVKLQAVFVFPLLLLLVLARRMPWRALLAVPAVYLALDVPALLLGASPRQLLTVYVSQADQYGQLTLNAPSVYQFVPSGADVSLLHTAGVVVTGLVVLALIGVVVLSRVELTPTRIVLAATTSAILVPFLLPSMHERYFYLADVLSVVAAFFLPRRLWALPVLVQTASFLAYVQVLSLTSGRGGPAAGAGHGGRLRLGGQPGFGGQPGSGGQPGLGGQPGFGGRPGGFGDNGTFRGDGSFGGNGFGGNGGAGTTSAEFVYLAAAMAAALGLVLWVAVREFRRPSPAGHPRPASNVGGST
jgi:Gpi18-like mannosyltransferase